LGTQIARRSGRYPLSYRAETVPTRLPEMLTGEFLDAREGSQKTVWNLHSSENGVDEEKEGVTLGRKRMGNVSLLREKKNAVGKGESNFTDRGKTEVPR